MRASVCACAHMRTCMCVRVCVHMHAHVCRSQRLTLGVFLSHCPSYFFRQCPSLNLKLTDLASLDGEKASWVILVSSPGVTDEHPVPSFLHGSWGLELKPPRLCSKSSLATEAPA